MVKTCREGVERSPEGEVEEGSAHAHKVTIAPPRTQRVEAAPTYDRDDEEGFLCTSFCTRGRSGKHPYPRDADYIRTNAPNNSWVRIRIQGDDYPNMCPTGGGV